MRAPLRCKQGLKLRNKALKTDGRFAPAAFLLFDARESAIDAALNEWPPVFSAAWARADQDLRALFGRAHEAGSLVMYMAGTGRRLYAPRRPVRM